ncbi:MAG: hypothetical protein HY226_01605 [Candidatus Vogelbacteria bacterium]|nr:hypothetical protein [Candidatus Vogelbacteria bacterium]
MKVLLYGKNSSQLSELLVKYGLEQVVESPDVVISFGGDGTYLLSERDFPGVPKVMIRDSKICKKCVNLPTEEVLKRLSLRQYVDNDIIKLEAEYDGKKYLAVNDIIMSRSVPTAAIRYRVRINDISYLDGREIVGDGLVVATPFGSGAYYRSITDGVFSVGLGLAFNNSTEQVDHIIIKETDRVMFELTRGYAVLAVPGYDLVTIVEGSSVSIKTAEEKGKILTFGEEFRYWAH